MGKFESQQILSWSTKYSADSGEFCPITPQQALFVIGTYQLQQQQQQQEEESDQQAGAETDQAQDAKDSFGTKNNMSHEGKFDIVCEDGPISFIEAEEFSNETRLLPDNNEKNNTSTRLGCLYLHKYDGVEIQLLQTIDMSAILDMKWSCQRICDHILLGVVTSVGEVLIYKLIEDIDKPNLVLYCKYIHHDNDTLFLSIDWSNRKVSSNEPLLTVSDSKGSVSIFQLVDTALILRHSVTSHAFEAWITAFNYWNPSVFYSGGDDCRLKGYDLRCGTDVAVMFTNKQHTAGVTSLHSNEHKEHCLASGSYDENVCVWDCRSMKTAVQECRVDGGVWRLKWNPVEGVEFLLAACMYNNFHVLGQVDSKLSVVVSYEEHKSIAYGADWSWDDAERVILAASFYDNFISLWKF